MKIAVAACFTYLKYLISRLAFCKVTGEGGAALASALRSDHCSLRELDLSFNHLGDQGVKLLTEIQMDSRFSLEKLKYTKTGCLTDSLATSVERLTLFV